MIRDIANLKIIALSDVHLGYKSSGGKNGEQSDIKAFKCFLENIIEGNDEITRGCKMLIFCGDIYEMWRNDITRLLESDDCKAVFILLKQLLDKDIQIHFISGNHDYWIRNIHEGKFSFNFDFALEYKFDFLNFFDYKNLLKIEGIFDSRISFHKNLVLRDKNNQEYEIYLLHGDEFDYSEKLGVFTEPVYDTLCFTTDASGEIADRIWKVIGSMRRWYWKIYQYTIGRIIKHLKWKKIYNNPASQREELINISKGIIDFSEDRKINTLIFGHTHRPFHYQNPVNKYTVINTGSWVKNQIDEKGNRKRYNTFVKIENYEANLYEFNGETCNTVIPEKLREAIDQKDDIQTQCFIDFKENSDS